MTVVTTKTKTETTTISSPLLERKIQETAAGLADYYTKRFLSIGNKDNAVTIVNYIAAMKVEINPSDHYRRDLIELLARFSKFNNDKNFKDITRSDIITFLDTYRKTETADPLHKWIGTYNLFTTHIIRFFRWFYYPEIEPKKRPKPPVVENIYKLKRKEISIYKPSDIWTQKDDLLFLKYCPSKRDKCYHAVSRDLSCRPHELLKLKIRDIAFKTIGTSQYAEVVVNGKTGRRPIPLINSIPFLKDYLEHEHPMPSNPNAPFICGNNKKLGRHIKPGSVNKYYSDYKKLIFPRLLDNPNVPPEDKQQIAELLKKPWNPYIRRHSALTEKSMILKESVLKQHSGWAPGSNMHLKYTHYYGNESNESLLESYGLVDPGIQINQLKPKQCPNCSEGNKPDSKFCAKCRMVLTYDAYSETIEEKQQKESEIKDLKEKYEQDMLTMREEIEDKFQQILAKIDTAKLT